MNKYFKITLLSIVFYSSSLMAQVFIQDNNGVYFNNSPIWAIPFCSDVDMNYIEPITSWQNCLWFQFNHTNPNAQVSFNTSGAPAGMISANDLNSTITGGDVNCSNGTSQFSFSGSLPLGSYFIYFNISSLPQAPAPGAHIRINGVLGLDCPYPDCNGCLPSIKLLPNTEYLVAAWVQKEDAPLGSVNYGDIVEGRPFIKLKITDGSVPPLNVEEYIYPSLSIPIVEGWQLIQSNFTTPEDPIEFSVELDVESGTALFDDVRIFPADGSMKCYVYDKTNLRFLAELDERHFATFYEYDAEGKLVRVKKETERGIMTIQETHQNASQAQP